MNEKEKSRRVQQIIVAACVIFAIFLLIGLISNIVTLASKNSRIAKLEAQIAELDTRIAAYGDEVEYWSDLENVTRYLREQEEMKKPDEIAFIGR